MTNQNELEKDNIEGFLSDRNKRAQELFLKKYSEYCSTFHGLTQLAYKVLLSLKDDGFTVSDRRLFASFLLFQRMIENIEACYDLIKKGFFAQSYMLVRIVIENFAKLKLVYEDPKYANEFIDYYTLIEDIKNINRILNEAPKNEIKGFIKNHNKALAELENKIKEYDKKRVGRKKIENSTAILKESRVYEVIKFVQPMMNEHIHSSYRSLEKYLDVDDVTVTGLLYGENYEDADVKLISLSEILWRAMYIITDIYEIRKKWEKQLEGFVYEIEKLEKMMNDKNT